MAHRLPPVDYQLNALRQPVAELKRGGVVNFDLRTLQNELATMNRDGINPAYEPLPAASATEGLDAMVETGELKSGPAGTFEIR